MERLTRSHIQQAFKLLEKEIVRTPVWQPRDLSEYLSRRMQKKVRAFVKCENLQLSGSFKYRGALHCLLKSNDRQLQRGVVTHSTGNHALALSAGAKTLSRRKCYQIPVSVVMSKQSTEEKVKKIKDLGAEVLLLEESSANACLEVARSISNTTGAQLIPPSDHPGIILGQGTATFEFLQQVSEDGYDALDAIIIPCGGGGLLAGAAITCQGSSTLVFGAEPLHGGARLAESIIHRHRLKQDVGFVTIADRLRASIGHYTWHILRQHGYVHKVFTVPERDIATMHEFLVRCTSMPVEPSSAVAVAAMACGPGVKESWRRNSGNDALHLGFILTGGNVCK